MDPIQSAIQTSAGRTVARSLGVALPPTLRRHRPGQALLVGPALLGAAPGGRLLGPVREALERADARVISGLNAAGDQRLGALVYDASGIVDPEGLIGLHDFFSPALRVLAPAGRVLVLGTSPDRADGVRAQVAQRALEGFTRSLAKELRGGATAQLVLVDPGAENRVEATVRFLASARSAFVDGQVIRLSTAVDGTDTVPDGDRPLADRVVVVTGAARGIGAAMVETLSRHGATVLGVDIPALGDDLAKVTTAANGFALIADVTAADTAARIARAVRDRAGTLHGIVHNAGITRDRKLVNLDPAAWDQVMAVNLIAPERITTELVAEGVLARGSRVVTISSIAGIAGNLGQTNYAASKAGIIGLVQALAPVLAPQGITINAIAPGFIETQMTQKVPLMIREGGRRLSSLKQGGLPVDVAETTGWLLDPAAAAVTGNVIRVCGQGLIGA